MKKEQTEWLMEVFDFQFGMMVILVMVSYDNQSSSKLNPTTESPQSSAGDDETAKTWSWSWTPSPIGGTVNM